MIYVDTSVLLAALLSEDRRPDDDFWGGTLVSSRLADHELWVRIQERHLAERCGEAASDLLARLAFVELTPNVLARLREPFPVPVRTLDAIHLASALFLRPHAHALRMATYDKRLAEAARALDLPVFEP